MTSPRSKSGPQFQPAIEVAWFDPAGDPNYIDVPDGIDHAWVIIRHLHTLDYLNTFIRVLGDKGVAVAEEIRTFYRCIPGAFSLMFRFNVGLVLRIIVTDKMRTGLTAQQIFKIPFDGIETSEEMYVDEDLQTSSGTVAYSSLWSRLTNKQGMNTDEARSYLWKNHPDFLQRKHDRLWGNIFKPSQCVLTVAVTHDNTFPLLLGEEVAEGKGKSEVKHGHGFLFCVLQPDLDTGEVIVTGQALKPQYKALAHIL